MLTQVFATAHTSEKLRESLLIASGRESCDARSEVLAMLYTACFSNSAIHAGNIPGNYNWGDVLMVNTMRREPKVRGYGIGLLALNRLVKHVARASPEWGMEGLITLDPSGLTQDMANPNDHVDVQDKLVRYYGLFGLRLIVEETRKHCAFVGFLMCFVRPKIHTVVPHLLQ